jgi:hypothetical protein
MLLFIKKKDDFSEFLKNFIFLTKIFFLLINFNE